MVYENLQQLLEQDITVVAESDTHYFVRVRPEEFFDNSMWFVDKETGLASYMDFTAFMIDHLDKDAHELDVAEFRRRFD